MAAMGALFAALAIPLKVLWNVVQERRKRRRKMAEVESAARRDQAAAWHSHQANEIQRLRTELAEKSEHVTQLYERLVSTTRTLVDMSTTVDTAHNRLRQRSMSTPPAPSRESGKPPSSKASKG